MTSEYDRYQVSPDVINKHQTLRHTTGQKATTTSDIVRGNIDHDSNVGFIAVDTVTFAAKYL